MCSSLEEELIYKLTPSRLDYFKTAIQVEKNVTKRRLVSFSESDRESEGASVGASEGSTDQDADSVRNKVNSLDLEQ